MPGFNAVKAVVTDIEGTTSSISFVHEVLFPYAAQHLPAWLRAHSGEARVGEQLGAVAAEAGLAADDLEGQISQLLQWIAEDRKATPLKTLQGYIWDAGYRNGDYRAHVYADVAPCLQGWREQGLELYVYSSGSVLAQKLFFEFSAAGNLLPLFRGHFDTTVGGKRERESYAAISGELGIDPGQLLFLSDVTQELEAARDAGFQVCLLVRPGNAPVGEHDFPVAESFTEIVIAP